MAAAVAHFRTPFLGISETFIYGYLSRLGGNVRPVVYTAERLNSDSFPFSDVVDYSRAPMSGSWIAHQLAKRIFGAKDWSLARLLKEKNIRLLHAHFGEEGYALLGVKKTLGIPLITTFYGYDVSELGQISEWREKYLKLFMEGDLFLVEGNHMKKSLLALGCPENKIKIQHIAVPVRNIPFRKRGPKPKSEPVAFLFCGRFVEKKGLIWALKAFKRALDQGVSNFNFRIIGGGPLEEELKRFVQAENMSAHIDFLGRKSHREFYDELERAEIFISPSVTAANGDNEGGAPTTILEAQAACLPILSTRHADIPEIVVEGKSALLCEERDDAALADNIVRLIRHQDLWGAMGEAGRRHVMDEYDLETETAKLEAVYSELLGRASALCKGKP